MQISENEWNVSNIVQEQYGGNEMELNHFMATLLLDPYFKING